MTIWEFMGLVIVSTVAYVIIAAIHAAIKITMEEHKRNMEHTEQEEQEAFEADEAIDVLLTHLLAGIGAFVRNRNRIIEWEELSEIMELVKGVNSSWYFSEVEAEIVATFLRAIDERELNLDDETQKEDFARALECILKDVLMGRNVDVLISKIVEEHNSNK